MTREYDGYTAFDYLEAGSDYQEFETFDRENAAEPYTVPLDEDEEARAERLMAETVTVSLHEHLVALPTDFEDYGAYTSTGWMPTAYDRLADGPLDAALMPPLGIRQFSDTVTSFGKLFSDLAHQDLVVRAESADDIRSAHENGQVAILPVTETAQMIENEPDRIDVLHGLGVRSMGLTYSASNALGSGLGEERDGGLTAFGAQAIERMNKVGVLVDASHASDQTTLDACEVSDDPVVISHDGAQELLDIARLDPDEVLTAVADTGGLIGIQAAPHNTSSPDHPRHSVDSVMDHFEYIVDLVGIDHVTFGPDTMYGDHVALHRHFGKDLEQYPDWVETGIDNVRGMDNPTEAWTNIYRWLVQSGYSDEEIAKVTGENTLRVLDEVI
jgi:membrane dipeptidase